jgi:hypothetical protein
MAVAPSRTPTSVSDATVAFLRLPGAERMVDSQLIVSVGVQTRVE